MNTFCVRELARNASAIINELDETKEPALITRRGRPVVYMLPVDSAQFEDFVLANAPEFVKGMAPADRELQRGETTSLAEARRLLNEDADDR
jgi:PHD/YefM family antitoxin component YafN of YafNO toxin-antitoxin module